MGAVGDELVTPLGDIRRRYTIFAELRISYFVPGEIIG